jgi:hypothetical protein
MAGAAAGLAILIARKPSRSTQSADDFLAAKGVYKRRWAPGRVKCSYCHRWLDDWITKFCSGAGADRYLYLCSDCDLLLRTDS